MSNLNNIINGNPKDIALIDANNDYFYTYENLTNRINFCISIIKEQIEEKSLVFLFCENTVEDIVTYLSFINSGNVIALFDKNIDHNFKTKLIDIYEPKIVFGSFDTKENNPHYNKKTKTHKDLSLLLSTSGSTGSPKLVRLTYDNVYDNAKNISEALSINKNERAITSLPMYYSYGLSVINSHLLSGATTVITSKSMLEASFWDSFRKYKCTSFAGVPSNYDILKRMDIEKLDIPSLTTLTQAGGKMNDNNIIHFNNIMKKRNGKLFVMYGQTEATARIAVMPSEELENKVGFVGKAIPNGTVRVKGNNGFVGPNEVGEILYEGKNVMMGYAESKDDLIKSDELNGILETGDVGFVDEAGFIKIVGRNKRFAKISGNRINLDELESLFKNEFKCAVLSDNNKIYVFCNIDNEKFNSTVKEIAFKTKIFNKLFEKIVIDEIPLNSNNKIDYSKLQCLI